MSSSPQYDLPFSPPLSWWAALDAQRLVAATIEAALAAVSSGSDATFGAALEGLSDSSNTRASEIQGELWESWSPSVPSRIGHTGDEAEEHCDPVLDGASVPQPMLGTPAEAWEEIGDVVAGLRERGVTGHDQLIRTLAVITSRFYREQGHGPRFLITAPPSAGKTFLLGALAETLGLPAIHIDASIITPEGWSGTNVSELLTKQIALSKRSFAQWEHGAVLVLDEIDKACRASLDDRHGSEVRLERQHTMLGLIWGGTPIRLTDGRTLKTDRWIVAACGAFATSRFVAENRTPTDDELIAWGMSPELASRLPTRFALTPHKRAILIELLRSDARGLPRAQHLAEAFGFTLDVPVETLACLAVAMEERPNSFTLRTASQGLCDAVIRRIVAMGGDRVGEHIVLAPDDVVLPPQVGRPAPEDWP